jgi:hypothetical protein
LTSRSYIVRSGDININYRGIWRKYLHMKKIFGNIGAMLNECCKGMLTLDISTE